MFISFADFIYFLHSLLVGLLLLNAIRFFFVDLVIGFGRIWEVDGRKAIIKICVVVVTVVAAQLASVTISFVINFISLSPLCIVTWIWNKKPKTQIANIRARTHTHASCSCCSATGKWERKQAIGYPVIWSFFFARLLVNLMLTTSIFTWCGWKKQRHDTMWTDIGLSLWLSN